MNGGLLTRFENARENTDWFPRISKFTCPKLNLPYDGNLDKGKFCIDLLYKIYIGINELKIRQSKKTKYSAIGESWWRKPDRRLKFVILNEEFFQEFKNINVVLWLIFILINLGENFPNIPKIFP